MMLFKEAGMANDWGSSPRGSLMEWRLSINANK